MNDSGQLDNRLPIGLHVSHAPRLKRMRQLTRVLDSAISIPGTNQKFGLDPLLGLIPGGGDTVSAALSGYIIVEAALMGIPRASLMRMVMNLLLDTVVGTVPVLGDIFDVFSKANVRNMQIVESHVKAPQPSAKADKLFIGLLIVGLIIFALAVGSITVLILSSIARLFG
jgi:Domain of unknown function (DUF4112)